MRRIALILIFGTLFLSACSKEKEVPELELQKTEFSQIETWQDDDALGLYNAFLRSCKILEKKKSEYLNENSLVKINRGDYLRVCDKAKDVMPAKFKDFLEAYFDPYLIKYKGDDTGKFTSYYEAEINASNIRDEVYKYPVYGRPYDLVEVNLRDFDASLPAKQIVGRVIDGKLKPYATREEITRDGVNAPVIMWADDEVDVYIMQIQGSAVANMSDGSKMRIAYAANNGHPFRGIGSILLDKGLLDKSKASMGNIKQWLKDNPGLARVNMDENKRYIFHKLGNPEGPVGAMGVPLTPGRSLAVDTDYLPFGALLWLETKQYNGAELNKLVIAQDVGSAIKGAIRGDYFYGSGGDDILEKAGKMNSKGRYFVLIPHHYQENEHD